MAIKIPACSSCGFQHTAHEPHVASTYIDPWTNPNVNIDSKYAARD